MCSCSPSKVLFRYMPLAGGASYIAFSSNIMDPKLFHEQLDLFLHCEHFSREGFFTLVCLWGFEPIIKVLTPYCLGNSCLAPYEVSLSNALWFEAHLGVGLYMYSRPHMTTLSTYKRVGYSIFSTVIFNFGSVLLWATTRVLLPENKGIRIAVGLGSALLLLYTGNEYVKNIDRQIESNE